MLADDARTEMYADAGRHRIISWQLRFYPWKKCWKPPRHSLLRLGSVRRTDIMDLGQDDWKRRQAVPTMCDVSGDKRLDSADGWSSGVGEFPRKMYDRRSSRRIYPNLPHGKDGHHTRQFSDLSGVDGRSDNIPGVEPRSVRKWPPSSFWSMAL